MNKGNNVYSYHPGSALLDASATGHGIDQEQLQSGCSNLIAIDGGGRYYASSLESCSNYVHIVQPEVSS